MKDFTRVVFVALALAGSSIPAFSQTTVTGKITLIRTGWNTEQFGVVLDQLTLNPGGCPSPDGYVTDSSKPGYTTYYAAALTAYLANQPIMVVIADTAGSCVASRPQLIGINAIR